MMKNVKILIADDHAAVRRDLRDLLHSQPGWKVVADVATGAEAIDKTRELHPNVVVLDISMPGTSGTEAIPAILQAWPQARVLVLAMHDAREVIDKAIQAGAHGY